MQTWYLLYCKPGQVQRAIKHLEHQSVVCLSPMIRIKKLIQGKYIMVTESMFPNYLFIEFDINKIHTSTIRSTRGVSHFIRFGAQPAVVPEDLIKQLYDYNHQISNRNAPCPGDNVIITRGRFAGLEATFSEPDGKIRSVLLLNLIDKQKTLHIKNSCFKKLSP